MIVVLPKRPPGMLPPYSNHLVSVRDIVTPQPTIGHLRKPTSSWIQDIASLVGIFA